LGLNTKLLKESFDAIKPHAPQVVELFYSELFKRHPTARDLFDLKEMGKQEQPLIVNLAHIVEHVENRAHLSDYLRKMGARHAHYGTEEVHIEWVGEALLSTLEYSFDAQWTDELRDTWTTIVFGVIAKEMKVGMQLEQKKIIEIKKEPAEPTLKEVAQKLSKDLFQKALEQEFNSPQFQEAIRTKARELLTKAIEMEAKIIIEDAKAASRAA